MQDEACVSPKGPECMLSPYAGCY